MHKSALLWFIFVVGICIAVPVLGLSVFAGPRERSATLAADSPSAAIRLRAATFVPSQEEPGAALASAGGSAEYLVQFIGPILPDWRAALEISGAVIQEYIPDYAYKVALTPQALVWVRALPEVAWIGPYDPLYRLSPDVQALGATIVRVELAQSGDAHDLLKLLPSWRADLIGQEGRTLLLRIDPQWLDDLCQHPAVRWVDVLSLPRVQNEMAAIEVRAAYAWSVGLNGEGQIINVADTGLDTGVDYPHVAGDMHLDVDNRVERIYSWPISPIYYAYLNNPLADDGAADLHSGHGTHVTGSAAGNGRLSAGLYSGVARRAQITFQALEQYGEFSALGKMAGFVDGYHLLGIPADLGQLYAQAYGWGARIHNNSWGGGPGGVYDEQTRQTDQFVWQNRDMLIVFSTGNDGRDANRDGRVDYGSVAPPATAKNILAVGSVENRRPERLQPYGLFWGEAFPVFPLRDDPMANAGADGMMARSSRGPTLDGRIAPHVVAPGSWIASMRSSMASLQGWEAINPYYMYNGGTSMSAALVSGAAALVRQSYQLQGHTQPSAALIKATLIQTARDIPGQYASPYQDAGPIPNNDEGWGVIDVQAATAGGRFFSDEQRALHTAEQAVYTYTVSAAARPSKFTLVWSDYPAAVEAAVQLVNDLDLIVATPNGQVYYGNMFSGGWSSLGGNPDRRNNVECVYLPVSVAGVYTVTVRAHNVPQGPQSFALLVDVPTASTTHLVSVPLVFKAQRALMPTATPTATSKPTLPPSPTPTPTLVPGEFRDDFSVITGHWVVTTTSSYAIEYLAGEYRMQLLQPYERRGSLPAVACAGDMLLEVSGRVANDAPQAYGLLFNLREQGGVLRYLGFVLSPTGDYALIEIEGDAAWMVVDWTASVHVARDAGVNRLGVRRIGQQVDLIVNGHVVRSLDGPQFAGGAGLGLLVLSGVAAPTDARLDDFRLAPLGGSALHSQSAMPQLLGSGFPLDLPLVSASP